MSRTSDGRSPRTQRPVVEGLEGRLFMSAAPTATHATATAAPKDASNVVNLGGNLQQQTVSGYDHGLNDLVKSGTFAGVGGVLHTDANGWPTSDFTVTLWGGSAVTQGRYTVVFNGPAGATAALFNSGSAHITNLGYSAATGVHTYAIDVPATGSNFLGLRLQNTGGQVRNLHVWQPGTDLSHPSAWSARYVNMLRSLAPDTLRMKDIIMMDKGNTTANWADRPKPTDATYNRAGASWEDLIQLCNQVGSNLWACIPAHATDDYVKNLANLVRTTLNPNLKVYVEYSNEVWNTSYEQGRYNIAQTQAEIARGGGNLSYDGNHNLYALADRHYAERSVQISNIFRQAWTSAGQPNPINDRVRVVLSSQVAIITRFDGMLSYVNHVFGAPNSYFYAIGVAPYFTLNLYNDTTIQQNHTAGGSNLTSSQILQGASLSVAAYETQRRFATYLSHASNWGLHLDLYESGGDTHGYMNISAKRQAQLDPAISGIIQRYLNAFKSQGGDLAMWYTLGARPYNTQYGTWTLQENPNDLNSPKMQAFRILRGRAARV